MNCVTSSFEGAPAGLPPHPVTKHRVLSTTPTQQQLNKLFMIRQILCYQVKVETEIQRGAPESQPSQPRTIPNRLPF
ncbi:hypothetical protein SAMN06265222_116136 [Neorhodopirellula lusitana]|uniref:Uncharacterized protein n=1 Tax=Neorhodopirellula lusitana TaxID=445327 RepID=A0ABY1QJU1_9BACT|nr:hypothetical protein SAMN06265222_116136 [Neorhodopirellula lusitana]